MKDNTSGTASMLADGRTDAGGAVPTFPPAVEDMLNELKSEIVALQKRVLALEGLDHDAVEAATIYWIETGDRSRLDDVVRRGGRL